MGVTGDNLGEESPDGASNFFKVRLQVDVAGVEQSHFGVGDVTFVGFGTTRLEGRIVVAPDR
jgi:hypothetical protein